MQANDKFAQLLENVVENRVVDNTVNAIGTAVSAISNRFRKIQTGQLEHYVLVFVVAVAVMVALLI
ncbi:MAG: hypothetical protein IPM82_13715 [Saprospiraceae bacterium]|nr:hypothetical protein [Saprospiraceae bacterium]